MKPKARPATLLLTVKVANLEMQVLFFLMSSFPHEPGCGPFDSHQTPGWREGFRSLGGLRPSGAAVQVSVCS